MTSKLLMAQPAAGGGDFSPLDLPGLLGWWDASNAGSFTYSSGVLVSQWNDLSGQGNHIAQSTVAKQPSRSGVRNGLETVVWNGTTQCLTRPSFPTPSAQYSIFAVAQSISGGDRVLLETSVNMNSNSDAVLAYKTNDNKMLSTLRTGTYLAWSTAATAASTFVYQTTLSPNNLSLARGYMNGSQSGSLTSTAANGENLARSYPLNVGSRNNGASNPWSGQIMEFGFCDGITSADDRTALDTYLNEKWAVY